MRSYQTNRWLLRKDTQLRKMNGWAKLSPDWDWEIIIPTSPQSEPIADMLADNVLRIPLAWSENVQAARYDFNFPVMQNIFDVTSPDVLLLEVPELARNWKAVMERLGKHVPIVSIVNHSDVFDWAATHGVGVLPRQVDGALISDLVVFHTEGTMEAWVKAAWKMFGDDMMKSIDPKIRIWRGTWNEDEIERPDSVVRDEPPAINFISRLSDNPRTHYEELMGAGELLADAGVDFQLWLCDPNENGSKLGLQPGGHITRIGPYQNREYHELLWRGSVVPILWPQWEMHSTGFCEAIATGNVVVTLNDGERDLPGIGTREKVTADSLAESLREALELDSAVRESLVESQLKWLRRERSSKVHWPQHRKEIESLVR